MFYNVKKQHFCLNIKRNVPMKKIVVLSLLAISVLNLSCDTDSAANAVLKSVEVHFTLAENYDDILEVEVAGQTKIVIPGTSSLNPCDGQNYVGVATYLFVSGTSKSYIIRDLSGEQVGSGTVKADADCVEVFLN